MTAPTSWPPPTISRWLTPGQPVRCEQLADELEAWARYMRSDPFPQRKGPAVPGQLELVEAGP